ncbi:MAG TPA: NAD(P)H-dependent oxidoreductase subunit E [Petrotogaceae bacterium]|nr:NAD(P)H-dependent oxidoreductase subunit E [Petrotogaceae bacterium]
MEVKVCVGTTCHLMGSATIIEEINQLPKEIADKITLKYATCFEVCHGQMKPPIIKIDDTYYENVTPEKVKQLIINKVSESK